MTDDLRGNPLNRRLGRRRVLQYSGMGAAGLAFLAACGGDDDGPASTSTPGGTGTPTGGTATATAPEGRPRSGTVRGASTTDISVNTGHPYLLVPQNNYLDQSVFEPIVQYVDSLEPRLILVDRFEYNDDLTGLVMSLKPGLEFHNGAPVTVEDVLFGLDVMRDPSAHGVNGAIQIATFARYITEAKKVDDRTIEFTFDQPRGNMTDFFAQLTVTHKDSFPGLLAGTDGQGTGPFTFAEWVPGQGYRLEAQDNWHLHDETGGPFVDAIEVTIFSDDDAAALAYEAGELDFWLRAAPSAARRFRDQAVVSDRRGVRYAGMNVTNPLLQDPRVRQAMFLSIDRQRFVDEVEEGFARLTVQPWPPTSPAFFEDMEAAFYDPDRARALLQEAGFTQDRPLMLEYNAARDGRYAELVQQNLGAIGVEVELGPMDGNAYLVKFQAREFPDLWLSLSGFAEMTPVTNFQQTFPFRIPNPSHYDRPEYVDMIEALAGIDPLSAEAKAQYETFRDLWLNDPWMLPYSDNINIHLLGPRLRGLDIIPVTRSGAPNFGEVWLED